MQTFLPFPDFVKSAQCLDRQRLGKQRVEVLQILRTLNAVSSGYSTHPAVLMWDEYTEALIEYGCAICDEWTSRGYVDNCRDKIVSFSWGDPATVPQWFGDKKFHRSHQSNLVRKKPEHYLPYFPGTPDDLEYVWPVTTRTTKGVK